MSIAEPNAPVAPTSPGRTGVLDRPEVGGFTFTEEDVETFLAALGDIPEKRCEVAHTKSDCLVKAVAVGRETCPQGGSWFICANAVKTVRAKIDSGKYACRWCERMIVECWTINPV